MRKVFFFVMSLIVLGLVACSREESMINNPNLLMNQSVDYNLNSDWNVKSDAMAFAVHQALRQSPEFSAALKKEVLKRVSGDYEVLLSTLSTMSIIDSSPVTKSGMEDVMTIGELLDGYMASGVHTKSSGSFIEDLQNQYPNMQISVPVHAEDWDEQSYIPTVVFVPEEFSDGETQYVPGYNSEGESVLVDAINEPSEPVIVVGMSERAGVILPELPEQPEVPTPAAPTSLVATQTSAGIMLTWQGAGSCTGYKVYRKVTSESNYTQLKILMGHQNTILEDRNVLASENYSYYVKAFNIPSGNILDKEEWAASFVYSLPSNMVVCQAPSLPSPVASLETYAQGTNVELRWSCDQNQNAQTEIYSYFGNNASFTLLNTLGGNLTNYIYTPPVRAQRIIYKVNRANELGQSSPVYDFIYPPYRNTASGSYVYVSSIKCNGDISEIESWVNGSPEFYLKIVTTDDQENPIVLQDKIAFSMDSRDNVATVFNRNVHNWWCFDPSKDWYSTLTFMLVEYDAYKSEFSAEATVGISRKDTVLGYNINLDLSMTASFSWENGDIYCGQAYLRYFENPNTVLYFPNYDIQVQLSDNSN